MIAAATGRRILSNVIHFKPGSDLAARHVRRSLRQKAQRRTSNHPSTAATNEPSLLPLPPPPPSPYQVLLDGKRFTCTECGKCCQGNGEVWANDAECVAVAENLGLPLQQFLARYTKGYSRRPGWRMFRVQPGSKDCIFLEGGTKCSIYNVRPLQCSTYPWWPELMDPAAWAEEGRYLCEGIEHEDAQPVDVQQAAAALQAATEYFAEQQTAARAAKPQHRDATG